MRTFTAFIGLAPHLPTWQNLKLPVFSPHCALFLTQGKAVGDHGNELGIRRLALYIRHGVAEKLLQHLV